MNLVRRCYNWVGAQVHAPHAVPLLAFLFFIESIILIPIDPLLALYCMEYPSRSWYFASVATLASIGGGLIGYALGAFCWDLIGHKMILVFFNPEQFASALLLCQKYQAWALLIGGFLPIPYKLLTLTAGFLHFPLGYFILFSALARTARFFLIAVILHYTGSTIKQCIDRYFSYLVAFFLLLVVSLVLYLKLR
jgi:membrane protein YqaA with SNARE-associated domain